MFNVLIIGYGVVGKNLAKKIDRLRHCLDKDVPAIAEFLDAELLKNIIAFNNKQKNG